MEKMFLVKGGEDLRNDERIELLFELMNSVVSSSSSSSSSSVASENMKNNYLSNSGARSSLKARTYTVIPMTSKVGILEWVCDTIPIKAVVTKEMYEDTIFKLNNPNFKSEDDIQQTEAFRIRSQWLQKNDNNYHKMFQKETELNGFNISKQINKILPNDFIRRKLLKMSNGPESYLTIRTEYSKSLSVSSLYGYILGLGDRHLENLLLDTKTGGIIQIDFGISFGMGQSLLPVPEFFPFRISPQLRGVLQPLDGTGLLRHYMVQTMGILREEESLLSLSNALQVLYVHFLVLTTAMKFYYIACL